MLRRQGKLQARDYSKRRDHRAASVPGGQQWEAWDSKPHRKNPQGAQKTMGTKQERWLPRKKERRRYSENGNRCFLPGPRGCWKGWADRLGGWEGPGAQEQQTQMFTQSSSSQPSRRCDPLIRFLTLWRPPTIKLF